MFAHDLHQFLAAMSFLAMGLVAAEGGVRAARATPPGRLAGRVTGLMLILVAATGAGGLALLAARHRPEEMLHLLYGVVAFAAVPVADQAAAGSSPRRRGVARLVGGVIGLGVILRLFATGGGG